MLRDVLALEAHAFPVFSVGIALPGATKDQPATVGASTTVGDVDVVTCDWIVADRDGVVVVPWASLDVVVDAGEAREAKESGFFDALRSGATTVELLGLDASLVSVVEPGQPRPDLWSADDAAEQGAVHDLLGHRSQPAGRSSRPGRRRSPDRRRSTRRRR